MATAGATPRRPARLADYVALARPDHWVKHVFILPGIVLAMVLHDRAVAGFAGRLPWGFVSAALLASANYVLNEWLDARTDAFHPRKADRPAVRTRLSPTLVAVEYTLLAGLGLACALPVSGLFVAAGCVFLGSGLLYNTPPIRLKEHAFVDVLTEAINNPIRLVLGWAMVDGSTLPPSSLLLTYWMGGAFLMAVKRCAERRSVLALEGPEALGSYRRSFLRYTETSLLVSAFVYALMAAFFLAVFFVKYRIEYLLSLPLFAALFGYYLRIGLLPDSLAERPERLFRDSRLLLLVALLVASLALLTWLDLPLLERLTDPHYIELSI